MGNNGSRDVFKMKVDYAPKIVPVDDMMIDKNQLQNCTYLHFSNSKCGVEESFSTKVNGVTFQILPRPPSQLVQVKNNIGKAPKCASSRESSCLRQRKLRSHHCCNFPRTPSALIHFRDTTELLCIFLKTMFRAKFGLSN